MNNIVKIIVHHFTVNGLGIQMTVCVGVGRVADVFLIIILILLNVAILHQIIVVVYISVLMIVWIDTLCLINHIVVSVSSTCNEMLLFTH